jgi:hypothetical protein
MIVTVNHIHTLCDQDAELLNVKTCGRYSYHFPLKSQLTPFNNLIGQNQLNLYLSSLLCLFNYKHLYQFSFLHNIVHKETPV